MSKFKIGDIVQVITQPSIYTWWAGEVVQVESEYVRVKFRTENTPLWFINDEVTLLVEAATNEINKPLTLHYNTAQYKAAVWHVYKKNFTEQGGAGRFLSVRCGRSHASSRRGEDRDETLLLADA